MSVLAAARAREAGDPDVPALVAAYEWLFAPPGARPADWDPDRAARTLRDLIADPRAAVLVAGGAGDVDGLCTVALHPPSVRFGERAWVADLAVHPDRRGRGTGRLLLDAARDWARRHGAHVLELESALGRIDAHRFYERERPDRRALSFGWELR